MLTNADVWQARVEPALAYYEMAEDYLAMVRVRCYQAQHEPSDSARKAALDAAEELIESSAHAAAALYLAQHYEALERPRDAMRLFAKAGRYNHAVRVARVKGFDKDIKPLALQAPKRTMLETARDLHRRGEGGTRFACFTSTKVRILTRKALRRGRR